MYVRMYVVSDEKRERAIPPLAFCLTTSSRVMYCAVIFLKGLFLYLSTERTERVSDDRPVATFFGVLGWGLGLLLLGRGTKSEELAENNKN